MIREILFAAVVCTSACIVPQGASGDTSALQAKVDKDPSKYISDNGKGVAFVKCARDDSFFGGPNEMARAVVEGCDASLTSALGRFSEIIDIDPVVVDGTTAGYMVLYATQSAPVVPEVKPEMKPEVKPEAPTSAPAVPYTSGQ
jgi:hypothetical protein